MCTGAIFRSRVGNVVYACSSARMSSSRGCNVSTISAHFLSEERKMSEIINSGKISSGSKMTTRDLVKSYQRNINIIGPILEDEASEVHVQFQALRKKQ